MRNVELRWEHLHTYAYGRSYNYNTYANGILRTLRKGTRSLLHQQKSVRRRASERART